MKHPTWSQLAAYYHHKPTAYALRQDGRSDVRVCVWVCLLVAFAILDYTTLPVTVNQDNIIL